MQTNNSTTAYIVVSHFRNPEPFIPKRDMEIDMVEKLEKMGFKPYQIRIMFERFKTGKLLLELENAMLAAQVNHSMSSHDILIKLFTEKYFVNFKNDEVTNKMKGVKNLQKYVKYLEKNKINWTYISVYDGVSKLKIGSLYYNEPIPKRMIE